MRNVRCVYGALRGRIFLRPQADSRRRRLSREEARMLSIENILTEESDLLDSAIEKQRALRKSVDEKDWSALSGIVSSMSRLMDRFNRLDAVRSKLTGDDGSAAHSERLAEIRGKLVRCRAENRALGDYIGTMRAFVSGVLNDVLPQSRNKLYSREGVFQPQPQSVVINTLS